MHQRSARIFLTLVPLTLSALSQSAPPTNASIGDWQSTPSRIAPEQKIDVVTIDQPHRRRSCHIVSFTQDELICSRTLGRSRTYLRQQVVALILPGDEGTRLPLWLGFNGGLGMAIWGTVILTTTCPPCAAATGVAALFFFAAAGATLIGDEQPDRLVYLAPGKQLIGKLRAIHP